jgi:hypothetical protein
MEKLRELLEVLATAIAKTHLQQQRRKQEKQQSVGAVNNKSGGLTHTFRRE